MGNQSSWDHLAFREYVISHAKGLGIADSTADLSRASGIGRSMLSKWFNGSERPSPASLERLAAAIRVDKSDLLAKAGWIADTGVEQAAPRKLDPLVVELDRLLSDDSKLNEEERDVLRGLVDRVLAGWRPQRNGRRRLA